MTESHDYGPNPFEGHCWPYPGRDAAEMDRIEKEHNSRGLGMRGIYRGMLRQIGRDYGISREEMIDRFEAVVEEGRRFRALLEANNPRTTKEPR